MGIIGSILLILLFGDFFWWWRADRAIRRLGLNQGWRIALGVFMTGESLGLSLMLLDRFGNLGIPVALFGPWLAAVYLWHCLLLLPMLLLWIPYALASAVVRGVRKLLDRRLQTEEAPIEHQPGHFTRREFVRLAGTAFPAVVTVGAAAAALEQLQHFRIRRVTIQLPTLPAALDGLTIVQVTDIHVGQFTHGAILDRIVAATNDLQADLVLFTGDLINFALSDLDHGLAALTRLKGKFGLYACEGNHDLFENPEEFRRRTRAAGVQLLVNETASLTIRGTPVQILGLRWGSGSRHPHDPAERGDGAIEHSARELLPQLRDDAFPILMAHHPHAFDYAGKISLTLSGHTHGGQLMVTKNFGFGPMLYRYWSGLYRDGDRSLFVSNGTGNWFPLRTRAPAEIVHLTLQRG